MTITEQNKVKIMSLLFGARCTVRIGANFSRQPPYGNLRAFQTLTTPKTSMSENNETKSPHMTPAFVGPLKMTNAIQSTSTVHYSSLSAIAAKLSSSPSYSNATKFIAQTTRSMAGNAPGSHIDGKPTLEYVKGMPKTFASMTNEQILLFAELEIPEACRECIVRDVMAVHNIEYDEAMKVFEKIAKTNREGMALAAFPFYLGFGIAVTAGYASFPLVFHKETVEWFNEKFVTLELPPPEDLETYFEVGAASWEWMEPILGHISFFLLCMQFSRAQLQNLGIRPYFNWQKERRSRYLIQKYPKYDAEFLANYSRCDRLAEPHDMTH
mmetsp:Transcript_28853/g.54551  ORF Transcript_28853/g.54551 Transcript_28853/m.54551 type:complete len:326 (-) Transcript_28853:201-1178(-)